jgi:hypothetical protein
LQKEAPFYYTGAALLQNGSNGYTIKCSTSFRDVLYVKPRKWQMGFGNPLAKQLIDTLFAEGYLRGGSMLMA